MLHAPLAAQHVHLLRNLFVSVLKRYARYFRPRFMVERRMGLNLLLDQTNFVDRQLLFQGIWEREQIDCLADFAQQARRAGEPTIFLDIGAHGALYSLLMRSTDIFDRIVAFEPVPSNLVQLRANLLMNDCLSRIEVVEKAVSDNDGMLSFVVAADENRGRSRIMTDAAKAGEAVIEVATVSIDQAIGCRGALVVAKIDVEGGELGVIRGMAETLSRNRVILQIECNQRQIQELDAALAPAGLTRIKDMGSDYYYTKL